MLPSPEHSDKLILRLKVLESKSISGPNFAKPGETVKAFTFESPKGLSEGVIITAEAEFLGDERGGKFRLTKIEA